MIIDVLINSCARPDLMDVSFKTFLKHIKTTHKFRFVIVEDKVENEERQALGREWIEQNKNYFDEILYLPKKAGMDRFYQEAIKLGRSPYFFRLEDDMDFQVDINIDPLIEILEQNQDICQITFRRDNHKSPWCGKKIINGVELTCTDFYSVSVGINNLEHTNKIIDECGWENQLHETKLLSPISKKLGYKKYVLGYNKWFWQSELIHYLHAGKEHRKGTWRL
jgi:hypothetical protein